MLLGVAALGLGFSAIARRVIASGASGATVDGMMGGAMGEMMSPGNMAGPMRTGMDLFRAHDAMHRTVRDIPGGIEATTVSADPRVAALIKEHVSSMYARLDENRPFPYPMSRSVPAMFANRTSYRRKLTLLPNGIAVAEVSDEPEMTRVIRAHAVEITGFVRDGMPAMMRGMM